MTSLKEKIKAKLPECIRHNSDDNTEISCVTSHGSVISYTAFRSCDLHLIFSSDNNDHSIQVQDYPPMTTDEDGEGEKLD